MKNTVGIAPPLKTFLKVQLLLVLACGVTEILCREALHLRSPYVFPLFSYRGSFWDFILFAGKFHHFHRPEFFSVDPSMPFLYPAPVAVFYEIFFYFGNVSLLLFLVFMLGTFVAAALLLDHALLQRGVRFSKSAEFFVGCLLLAYPLWFDFKQANVEIGIWVFVALGVWAFCANRGYTAATCFGVAGAMKIFPFIYFGLLLAHRKYREMFFSALVAIVTTVASLWLLGGNHLLDTWHHVEIGVSTFRTTYILHYRPLEIGFDHSLFSLVKICLPHRPDLAIPSPLLTAYLATGALAGLALYFLKIRHLPRINQVLCLSVASILLPPVSYDYTLIHLYIPWAMLVLFAQDQAALRRHIPGLTAAFILLAILVSPQSEFIYNGVRFGGQIKACVLTALMVIGLQFPFHPVQQQPSQPTA